MKHKRAILIPFDEAFVLLILVNLLLMVNAGIGLTETTKGAGSIIALSIVIVLACVANVLMLKSSAAATRLLRAMFFKPNVSVRAIGGSGDLKGKFVAYSLRKDDLWAIVMNSYPSEEEIKQIGTVLTIYGREYTGNEGGLKSHKRVNRFCEKNKLTAGYSECRAISKLALEDPDIRKIDRGNPQDMNIIGAHHDM